MCCKSLAVCCCTVLRTSHQSCVTWLLRQTRKRSWAWFILFIYLFFWKPFQAPHLFFTRLIGNCLFIYFSLACFLRYSLSGTERKQTITQMMRRNLIQFFFILNLLVNLVGYNSRAEGAKKSNSHFSDGTAGYPPENQTVVFHEVSDRTRQQLFNSFNSYNQKILFFSRVFWDVLP